MQDVVGGAAVEAVGIERARLLQRGRRLGPLPGPEQREAEVERGHGSAVVVGDERAQHADRGVHLARAVAQQRAGDLHAQIARAEQRAGAPQRRRGLRPVSGAHVGGDRRERLLAAPRLGGEVEHERRRALQRRRGARSRGRGRTAQREGAEHRDGDDENARNRHRQGALSVDAGGHARRVGATE